jgi:hypothetical protein
MRVPPIESMPFIAGPAEWSRTLFCDQVTIWRAANVYKTLERANPGSARPLYSRDGILRWLGVSQFINEPAPVAKNPRKAAKRRRRAAETR